MHITYCKLSSYMQQRFLEHFVADTPARTAADLVSIHRNSTIHFFHKLRCTIFTIQQERVVQFFEKVDIDKSYFGGVRKGKRGRGVAGKTIVFGLLKRRGKVYTIPIPDVTRDTLPPVIREKIKTDSVVSHHGHIAYNALDVSEFSHYRINHRKEIATSHNHINGIENFWNQAKRHRRKYNGIPRQHFELFLKECEWRFNGETPKQLSKT
ncbi:MAG: IS1595 family transposase [Deltaproteobacteria bacterium]|nr:MAG: IS1595 family transposase [Deltaproteobacteria bacterium]